MRHFVYARGKWTDFFLEHLFIGEKTIREKTIREKTKNVGPKHVPSIGQRIGGDVM